jgi:hypothetical protein
MAKSAQARFNEYLDECRSTQTSLTQLVDSSRERFGDYGYAVGFLQSFLAETIAELPKARREDFRNRLIRQALVNLKEIEQKKVDKQTA